MKTPDAQLVQALCRGYLVTGLPELVHRTLELFDDRAHLHGITKTWRPWLATGAALHGMHAGNRDAPAAGTHIADRTDTLPAEPEWGRRVLEMMLAELAAGSPGAAARSRGASPVQTARRIIAVRMAELVGEARDPSCAMLPPLLSPSDTLGESGIKVLRRQFDQFTSREYGLPLADDSEYVHEMRVATRRMRAALRVFRDGLGPWAGAVKTRLSGIAGELGVVRDADVFGLFLQRYAQSCPPGQREFVNALVRCETGRRRRAAAALATHVQSAGHRRFVRTFRRQMDDRLAEGARENSPAAQPLGEAAPRLLKRKLKRVLQFDRSLKRYSSDGLHALRIACKRLRYSAEFVAGLYPDGLGEVVEFAGTMQKLLGDVHDADVYQERVRAYAGRRRAALGGSADASAIALHRYLDAWRDEELRKAESVWKKTRSKSGRHTLKAAWR